MDAAQAVQFLTALKCKHVKIKNNGWVEAACPLAPWTHKSGKDSNPSFGVTIDPGKRSYFSCFSCMKGSVEELVQLIALYAKETIADYDIAQAHALIDDELKVLPLPEYGSKLNVQVFEEWPKYWLDAYVEIEYHEQKLPALSNSPWTYLALRKVPVEIVHAFKLRWDDYRKMVVAPYWDVFGRFAGARGRSILPDTSGPQKHFDYSWNGRNNSRLVWYNEQCLHMPGPVVVVEGQFDCWRTSQAYPKVVANLTARPMLEKLKKLGDSPFVIQIPDRDDAGIMSADLYAQLCKKLGIRYKRLTLDDGVKDPDDCHPEYLKTKIQELL